jgi:outer membrane protein
MHNKIMKSLPLALACVLLAGPGALLQAAELKIGVVNVRQLMEESPQSRAATRAIEDEFAPRKRDLENQQKEYKAREEKLQRDAAVMSEAERTKAERDMRDSQRDLQRKVNEFQEDLNVRQNEEIGRMQRTLLEEIQSYAKAQGYDLILGDVLFAKDAINITAAVLGALESKSKAPAAAPATK